MTEIKPEVNSETGTPPEKKEGTQPASAQDNTEKETGSKTEKESEQKDVKEEKGFEYKEPVVRKSVSDYVKERQTDKLNRRLDKIEENLQKKDDEFDFDTDNKNKDKNKKETKGQPNVDPAYRDQLETLTVDQEIGRLFTKHPEAEKLEKHIRSRMKLWPGIPARDAYFALAGEANLAKMAKEDKVNQAKSENISGSDGKGTEKEGTAEMSDAEILKYHDKQRKNA
ncbi:MAG: hypothetical protein U9R08_02950 [Nanoarchaeota archaeon]|nr:hypothetical protein [Nanoarchaeota archaeon]